MNTLIYGKIGGGKTYYALKNYIIPALKNRRFVYTNIDIPFRFHYDYLSVFSNHLGFDVGDLLKIVKDTKEFLSMLELVAYDSRGSKLPHCSVVVIDEAHQIFNYLDTNKINRRVYEFLAYSRHFGIDLVFISQSPELLNKFVVELCNEFVKVEALKYRSSLMKNFQRIELYTHLNSHVPVASFVKKFDTDIFKLYRSYVSETDSTRSLTTLLPGWSKPAFGLVVLLFILFFVSSNSDKIFKFF